MTADFMERGSKLWLRIGQTFERRPAQVCGLLLGAIILIAVLFYATTTATNNRADITQIQAAFCNGDEPYTNEQQQNCRQLLDKLLNDPTPEQARRLREIVKGTP